MKMSLIPFDSLDLTTKQSMTGKYAVVRSREAIRFRGIVETRSRRPNVAAERRRDAAQAQETAEKKKSRSGKCRVEQKPDVHDNARGKHEVEANNG